MTARRFPWTDRAGRFSGLKAVALAAAVAPAAWLALALAFGWLGPKPVTAAMREAGDWALRFLLAAYAVSPLRRLLDRPKLILVRRILGVSAFAWVFGHFVLYVADQGWNLPRVASEIVLRIYLTIGFVALMGLAALAATSTDAMVRRLGAERWNRWHRLVHALGLLALVHTFMQTRLDAFEVIWMAGLWLLLASQRVAHRLGFATDAPRFAMLALGAALVTMLGEALWYGAGSPFAFRGVLAAHLEPMLWPRPAMIVIGAGLVAALLAAWLRGGRGREVAPGAVRG